MYRLLALDMDGTVLNHHGIISKKNIIAIKKALESGVKVSLVSGRSLQSLLHFSREVGIDGYLGALNGAMIYDMKKDQCLQNNFMTEKTAKKAIHHAKGSDLLSMAFLGDDIIIDNIHSSYREVIQKFSDHPLRVVEDLNEYLDANQLYDKINKIAICDEYDLLNQFKEKHMKSFDETQFVFSLPFFLEIYDQNTSKARAVEYIAKIYGIVTEDIIAIGDGENDIEMIRMVGKGVAMGNAMESVINVADEVTLSNREDGVAHIIEKYIL